MRGLISCSYDSFLKRTSSCDDLLVFVQALMLLVLLLLVLALLVLALVAVAMV